MPIDGVPFRTDFDDSTPMGPEIHAPIHNAVNAALNEISDVLDVFAELPPGTVTPTQMEDAIEAAIATVTVESIGAIPDTESTITLVDNVLTVPTRASHPSAPTADHVNFYGLNDESVWVQTSTNAKTQLGPPWESPSVILATSAAISSAATWSDVLTAGIEAAAAYRVHIFGAYVADTALSTGRLLTGFTVPTGAVGSWTARTIQSGYTGASGSTTMTQLSKHWGQTAASGGIAGQPVPLEIVGVIITAATAGDFVLRAKLNEAGPTATIYGMDQANFSGTMMTLTRVG